MGPSEFTHSLLRCEQGVPGWRLELWGPWSEVGGQLELCGHRAGKGLAQAGGQCSATRPGVKNTQLMVFPIHPASYSS